NLASRGCASLNSSLEATALCADKLAMGRHLRQQGISAVGGCTLREARQRWPGDATRRVIKPRWGAGCERTYVCEDAGHWPVVDDEDAWIVQPWVEGAAASCAVLVVDGQAHPLRVGAQWIAQDQGQLHYQGGRMALESAAAMAMATA